jgi:hypothetical protein
VTDQSDRFQEAIAELNAIADAVPSDDAHDHFDPTTLQLFWREWPHISSWAGALWRRLNEDLEQPASPPQDPDLDEVGGEGGG